MHDIGTVSAKRQALLVCTMRDRKATFWKVAQESVPHLLIQQIFDCQLSAGAVLTPVHNTNPCPQKWKESNL